MTTLRIAAVGFDTSEATYIKTTVDLASGLDIGSWRYVEAPEAADVVLTNAASRSGRSALERLQTGGGGEGPRVVAWGGEAGAPQPGALSPPPPISYAGLVGLLQRVQAELAYRPKVSEAGPAPSEPAGRGAEAAGRAPEGEPLPRPAPRPGPSPVSGSRAAGSLRPETRARDLLRKDRPARKFFEAARLLGILKEAVERGQVTAVMHHRHPPLWIYPEQGLYATPFEAALTPRMFRTLASEFSVRTLGGARGRDPLPKWDKGRLGRLLYLAALYGSEGRLLKGNHFGDRLRLRAAPDFGALPDVAGHRVVADFMLGRRADIATVAAETGVSVETVIDFCNACEQVLLIDRESVDSEPVSEPPGEGGLARADGADPWRIAAPPRGQGLLRRFQALFRRSA
jgi:hypothetical protein